jgi:zinc transporter ZupT
MLSRNIHILLLAASLPLGCWAVVARAGVVASSNQQQVPASGTTKHSIQHPRDLLGSWLAVHPEKGLLDFHATHRRDQDIENVTDIALGSNHTDDGEDHDEHEEEGEEHEEHEGEDHDEHEEEASHSEENAGKKKPWLEVIVTSLVINMASLSGLIVVILSVGAEKLGLWRVSNPGMAQPKFDWQFTHNIIPSFACGALLATCVFLIIPEAVAMLTEAAVEAAGAGETAHEDHRLRFLQDMIQNMTTNSTEVDDHEDHAEEEEEHGDEHEEHADTDVPVAWRLGTCLISGFLLPILSSLLFPHAHDHEEGPVSADERAAFVPNKEITVEDETGSKPEEPANSATLPESNDDAVTMAVEAAPLQSSLPIDYGLASAILVGDFFHNFTDGVFVGTAFSLCNRDLAIAISAATVYHEIAQEIADYFMLTKHCNLSPPVALVCNFCGGFSVLIGAVLVTLFDISVTATGCILAMGGGVYIYIAVGECLPRARKSQKNKTDKIISLVSFVVGVIPIGLVLLNHGHCEVEH